MIEIIASSRFTKTYKKLLLTEKEAVDAAIHQITQTPDSGNLKRSDIAGIRVYKFRMHSHIILLAYEYHETLQSLTLLFLGPHENFYRDLKH